MKRISIIFTGVFLSLISLPFVFMDHKSVVSEKENRNLAAFPNFKNDDNVNTANFTKYLDEYISDRFGFRNIAVSFGNNISKAGKAINGDVVVGKNDWLFYSSHEDGYNIADFFKINLFTDDEINRFIHNIEARLEWCNENNIKFIFLIAPNKHNIYPEYYPFERPDGITRTDQIIAALPDNLKDIVIYPRDYLLQNKVAAPLYYETDTHWNMAGAHHAFEIIFDRLKNDFPNTQFPELKFTTEITYGHEDDMGHMSGFTDYGNTTIPNVSPQGGWESFYKYIKNKGREGVVTENDDKTLPKAIIYRDSFFSALEPFTSSVFSGAEYNWRGFSASEKGYILEHKPDIIIWETVERGTAGIPRLEWN
jgi:hypothetical protein